jgi:hypothetical protein
VILTLVSSAARMSDVMDAGYRMSFMELVCASSIIICQRR